MKELEVRKSQVDKLKQEISSYKDQTQELEHLVSELKLYKEQAQVNTHKLVESMCFKSSDINRLFIPYIQLISSETKKGVLFFWTLSYTTSLNLKWNTRDVGEFKTVFNSKGFGESVAITIQEKTAILKCHLSILA